MIEDDDGNSNSDSEEDTTPEMDLLAELNKMQIDTSTDNNNVCNSSAISKASSKLMTRSNPVFEFGNRSAKVGLFLFC